MNYLAHLFLSGDDPLLRIGNLAGDFVKGIDTATLHPTIEQGITVHRSVDAFTDRHEIVWRSKSRIGSPHTRLAGILVDVFYDHFLAINWHAYCDKQPLEAFVADVYGALKTHHELLPPLLQDTAPRMMAEDWLTSYRDMEGIVRALSRIEQRLGRDFDLTGRIDELERNRHEMEEDFRRFFPELMAFLGL